MRYPPMRGRSSPVQLSWPPAAVQATWNDCSPLARKRSRFLSPPDPVSSLVQSPVCWCWSRPLLEARRLVRESASEAETWRASELHLTATTSASQLGARLTGSRHVLMSTRFSTSAAGHRPVRHATLTEGVDR